MAGIPTPSPQRVICQIFSICRCPSFTVKVDGNIKLSYVSLTSKILLERNVVKISKLMYTKCISCVSGPMTLNFLTKVPALDEKLYSLHSLQ
jgi:hypothetical protein